MRRAASSTKQDLDGILMTPSRITNRDQIIAQRVETEIEHHIEVAVAANFALADFARPMGLRASLRPSSSRCTLLHGGGPRPMAKYFPDLISDGRNIRRASNKILPVRSSCTICSYSGQRVATTITSTEPTCSTQFATIFIKVPSPPREL